MTLRVVLTGATGFIGTAVLNRLASEEAAVRALTRRELRLPPDVEQVRADLTRPESLTGACSGADVLVHAAPFVGSDEQPCVQVNDLGTEALMEEAARAGVGRIVQVSTTAVYGRGPHRGEAVGDLEPAPGSATSRTRLAGEKHALKRGALVLRAGLVTGAGDRWVVPALAELTRRVPGYWLGGGARLSMIAVEDLARIVTHAALRFPAPAHGVHHAVHPEPVRNRDLLDSLASLALVPPVEGELTWEQCLTLMREHPGRIGDRQLELLAYDHFYSGASLWKACELAPGPGPLARLDEAADWYRGHLTRS